MHPAFSRTEHRPWALPRRPWTWRQCWLDLLFMHWPVPTELLRPLVPDGLDVQEFDGSSWIGVVPFRMEGVMRRPFPDMPGVSAFPELNVRLYVEAEGKPGVWFLSLDASNALAVWAARRFFHLPYYRAEMSLVREGAEYVYSSHRCNSPELFVGRYQALGEAYEAAPGTLEHWLTERYCLYARDPSGRLLRNEVHHQPWSLQRAQAQIEHNTMLDGYGLTPTSPPQLLHFSSRIDVVVWDAEVVAA